MCRFIAYLGAPIVVEDLLIKPKNSLVNQSFKAKEMDEPLNGDGFGMGWYDKDIREDPGMYKSIIPAWNNTNLKYMSRVIKTNCVIAHIRAATEGVVTELNCHPFHYRHYLMMHNGRITGFEKIKRNLRRRLSDYYYNWIKGQTDSEHLFALYMQHIGERGNGDNLSLPVLAEVFKKTLEEIAKMKKEAGVDGIDTFNMVSTNGRRIIAARYSTNPEKEHKTLYYTKGNRYVCENGLCKMRGNGDLKKSVLIVSEKLNNHTEDWHEVPKNSCLLVDKESNIEICSLS